MVVVEEHDERLLAADEPRGRAVAQPLGGLGQRQAERSHAFECVPIGHNAHHDHPGRRGSGRDEGADRHRRRAVLGPRPDAHADADRGRPAGRRRHGRRDDPRGLPPGRHRARPAHLDRRRLAGRRRRRERHRHGRPQPPEMGGCLPARGRAPGRARPAGLRRQRRPRRDERRVPPRRRPALQLGARRLLGHRRRRRGRPRRQAVAGPGRRGRDRSHRRQARRRPLPLRTARVHGGLRGPRRDGDPRPQRS